jgi:hypothetical protein
MNFPTVASLSLTLALALVAAPAQAEKADKASP